MRVGFVLRVACWLLTFVLGLAVLVWFCCVGCDLYLVWLFSLFWFCVLFILCVLLLSAFGGVCWVMWFVCLIVL